MKHAQEHVRRPMNCFFLWRKEARAALTIDFKDEERSRSSVLMQYLPDAAELETIFGEDWETAKGMPHETQLCTLLGHTWRTVLSEAERDVWREKADMKGRQHAVDNPGYKFAPVPRSRTKPKRPKTAKTSVKHKPSNQITPPSKKKRARKRPRLELGKHSSDPSRAPNLELDVELQYSASCHGRKPTDGVEYDAQNELLEFFDAKCNGLEDQSAACAESMLDVRPLLEESIELIGSETDCDPLLLGPKRTEQLSRCADVECALPDTLVERSDGARNLCNKLWLMPVGEGDSARATQEQEELCGNELSQLYGTELTATAMDWTESDSNASLIGSDNEDLLGQSSPQNDTTLGDSGCFDEGSFSEASPIGSDFEDLPGQNGPQNGISLGDRGGFDEGGFSERRKGSTLTIWDSEGYTTPTLTSNDRSPDHYTLPSPAEMSSKIPHRFESTSASQTFLNPGLGSVDRSSVHTVLDPLREGCPSSTLATPATPQSEIAALQHTLKMYPPCALACGSFTCIVCRAEAELHSLCRPTAAYSGFHNFSARNDPKPPSPLCTATGNRTPMIPLCDTGNSPLV